MSNASLSAGSRILTAAEVALLLGACGGSTTNSATSTPAASSSASPSSAAPAGTSVGVIEKEFSITPGKASFTPGAYTFAVKNQRKYPHKPRH